MSKDKPSIKQQTGREPRQRRAFTLIELTVALAISSILLVTIGAAVVIASQAQIGRAHV